MLVPTGQHILEIACCRSAGRSYKWQRIPAGHGRLPNKSSDLCNEKITVHAPTSGRICGKNSTS